MKKLLTPLVALAVIATALIGGPTADAVTPVQAAPAAAPVPPPPPPPPPPYSPKTGILFNNPTVLAQQFTLLDHLTRSIESTPPGATIRLATYSFSYTPASDALIAAYKRGVIVKLLIDSHVSTPEITKLKKTLGRSKKKPSYVATCHYGCMSSKPSFMHAKIYLFSAAGASNNVTMLSSGNPAWGGATNSWNNTYTIVGDTTLYNSNVKYFNDMLADKTNTAYYRTTGSGPYREYFYPRAGKTNKSDTLYNVLSATKCTGAAPGYGNAKGRTVIRIGAYLWTTLRLGVAQKVVQLAKQGCDVQIVYSADTVERPVALALLKGKHVPIYNARLDRNHDGTLDIYIHSKYLIINGYYGGVSNVKAVWTGSPNFSGNSLRQSNETGLKIQINSVYDAFLANFNLIRDGWTKRVTKPPKKDAKTADARALAKDASVTNHDSRLSPNGDYQIRDDDE